MKHKTKTRKVMDAMRESSKGKIPTDVDGSYTGVPEDGGEPVQDADDL